MLLCALLASIHRSFAQHRYNVPPIIGPDQHAVRLFLCVCTSCTTRSSYASRVNVEFKGGWRIAMITATISCGLHFNHRETYKMFRKLKNKLESSSNSSNTGSHTRGEAAAYYGGNPQQGPPQHGSSYAAPSGPPPSMQQQQVYQQSMYAPPPGPPPTTTNASSGGPSEKELAPLKRFVSL